MEAHMAVRVRRRRTISVTSPAKKPWKSDRAVTITSGRIMTSPTGPQGPLSERTVPMSMRARNPSEKNQVAVPKTSSSRPRGPRPGRVAPQRIQRRWPIRTSKPRCRRFGRATRSLRM